MVNFPPDVLVEILRRLRPTFRLRCRLVCRYWRDTIDERTEAPKQSQVKTLMAGYGSAYVLVGGGDDDGWSLKKVMGNRGCDSERIEVVGTCNGLLCLCDNTKPGGAIRLANPTTGEKLALPPVTRDDFSSSGSWHCAYSFAHNEMTGRYTVVHVPCRFRGWEFNKLQVFTLGEACWRDIPTPAVDVSCRVEVAGIVSVDGATYWVAQGSERIVSLDLEEERVTTISGPPMPAGSSFNLVEAHGRLGVAVFDNTWKGWKTKVLVRESVGGEHRWVCWYHVECRSGGWLLNPRFMHGEYLLRRANVAVYANKPSGKWRSRHGDVLLSRIDQGKEVYVGIVYRAFSYVETDEPLSRYRLW